MKGLLICLLSTILATYAMDDVTTSNDLKKPSLQQPRSLSLNQYGESITYVHVDDAGMDQKKSYMDHFISPDTQKALFAVYQTDIPDDPLYDEWKKKGLKMQSDFCLGYVAKRFLPLIQEQLFVGKSLDNAILNARDQLFNDLSFNAQAYRNQFIKEYKQSLIKLNNLNALKFFSMNNPSSSDENSCQNSESDNAKDLQPEALQQKLKYLELPELLQSISEGKRISGSLIALSLNEKGTDLCVDNYKITSKSDDTNFLGTLMKSVMPNDCPDLRSMKGIFLLAANLPDDLPCLDKLPCLIQNLGILKALETLVTVMIKKCEPKVGSSATLVFVDGECVKSILKQCKDESDKKITKKKKRKSSSKKKSVSKQKSKRNVTRKKQEKGKKAAQMQ